MSLCRFKRSLNNYAWRKTIPNLSGFIKNLHRSLHGDSRFTIDLSDHKNAEHCGL